MMFPTRLIISLLTLALIVGCNDDNSQTDSTGTAFSTTTEASSATERPEPSPTASVTERPEPVPTVAIVTATQIPTPVLPNSEVFDAATVMGRIIIDLPIEPYDGSTLAIAQCRLGGAAIVPEGIILGTVPLPTPAPAANSVSMPNIGANRLLIEQYIKTIYPSLVTAVDWATVIDDVDFEVLKSGQILSLIRMESSRMSGVCDALALISPPTEVEIFHADFSEALLSRYSDLNVGRDLAVAAGTEITQISSSLSNSSTAIKKLDRELEELAINSGLNYPPLLAGVTLKSAGLEVELVVPPGWQVSGVFHNVSLLAPPRLQGGGLRDVGLQFDASGSEFVYSRLRNPSGYGDQDIIDRVARLMNSYGELQSTAGFDFASRDGYVLELIEGSQNIRTTVWVVSIDGWSRIFRVSCPEDVHEFCVEDIIPMIDSAKFSG